MSENWLFRLHSSLLSDILLRLGIVAILVSLLSCWPVTINALIADNLTLLEYENSELGFKIKYPSGWQIQEDIIGVSFTSPKENESDKFLESFQLGLTTLHGIPPN